MPSFKGSISSKLPKTGTTIFTVMSALARENNAINLSQGFPDFPVSAELTSLVTKYMQLGYNQYPPMQGVITLREAIVEKMNQLYGCDYHPETDITITAGATQAIYTAITSLINEGDEVIMFTPAYDCYEPAIELNGGKTVYVQLNSPDYKINWNGVKRLINHKTKMIIVNTPHNPTGSTMTFEDMKELEKITEQSDIIVLSDEVYEHITFDGQEHQSVARFPKLAERSVIVYSFGKTFHATGWKIGYAVAPKELMVEFRKVHQYIVFTVNTPIQMAFAEYLINPQNYLNISSMYQQKRDLFISYLQNSRFNILPCTGTYFQLLGFENISDEKDTDFAIRLTQEYKVASIPVSVFYHNPIHEKVLRFCFAKQDSTIVAAAEILSKI